MPKSRRNKLVSLTETEKKTREHKEALVDLVGFSSRFFAHFADDMHTD